MLGFHPSENLTIRFGGRATYLQGEYEATYDTAMVTPGEQLPSDDPAAPPVYGPPTFSKQGVISTNNPLSFLRYGALFELTGRF